MGLHSTIADLVWTLSPGTVSSAMNRLPDLPNKTTRLLKLQSEVFGTDNQIRCWWERQPLPGNVGDILTPIILKFLFGLSPVFSPQKEFVGIGSIIRKVAPTSVVWGSGLLDPDRDVAPAGVRFLAVRGPLTWAKLKQQGHAPPEVFGDPALLMPRAFDASQVPLACRVGYVPHYSHPDLTPEAAADVRTIDVLRGTVSEVFSFIEQINQCEVIASSSLHGLILAVAYGKPIIWLELADRRLDGDRFKFADFFSSIGRPDIVPIPVSSPGQLARLSPQDAELLDVPPSVADGLISAFRQYRQRK